VSLGDSLAALFGVIGTLAALRERSVSGKGQQVDVAIYESVAALMESSMADYELAGVLRGRSGSVLPGVAPSNVYPTADGTELLIAANADAVFARLCAAMGRPELARDERFATHGARGEAMAELDALIADWTCGLPAEVALSTLAEHGVPAGRIYTAADMASDPHYLARDMVVRRTARTGHEVPMAGVVPKFSRTPGGVVDAGPSLGEHTAAVLAGLAGLGADELARLQARRVI
jgi:formyl-CoA transferase/succinyl-CoA--D-citramalate CoA-transferase